MGKALPLVIFFLFSLSSVAELAFDQKTPLKSPDFPSFKKGEDSLIKGDFEASVGHFKEALRVSREKGDLPAETACLAKLGLLNWHFGQIPEAVDNYSNALAIARRSGQKEAQGYCEAVLEAVRYYNSGKNLRETNDLKRSEKEFSNAIEISRRIGNEEILVKSLRQKSITYWQMNDQKSFLESNEKALETARKIKHRIEEGRCLNNIGLYHWKLSNFSFALKYFQEALLIARELKEVLSEAECLSNMGLIYKELGDSERALSYLSWALEIDKKLNIKTSIVIDMTNIGTVLRDRGVFNNNSDELYRALDCFEKALRLIENEGLDQIRISLLNNIGWTYGDLGDFNKAISFYKSGLRSAAQIGLIEEKAFLYNNMGEACLVLNNISDASTYFQKAISLGVDNKFGRILWEAYFGIGQCAEKGNDCQAAISYYNKSIELIDKIRSRIFVDTFKAGFARDKLKVYERLLNLLFKSYEENPSASRIEELFSVVEKAKARAFLETLGDARIDLREGLSPGLKKREEEVSGEISTFLFELSRPDLDQDEREALILKLGRAEDEYVRLISEMRAEQPELANLVSPKICTLRQVQESILDDRTGLVEFYLGETRSFMFLATKKDLQLYPLPSRAIIEASLKGYLKVLHSAPRDEFLGSMAAERIAGEILSPLRLPDLQSIDNLIIVPDGVLYYLPFETLSLSDENKPSVQYMIERYAVSYSPSSSSLFFLIRKESGPRSKRLLAFGNPVYQRGSGLGTIKQTAGEILREFYLNQGFHFSPLPFSKKEVRGLSKHFPAGKAEIFLGKKAKEEVLKSIPLAEYGIVHFACHGLLDEQVPFRSALVLSIDEDKKEDGFLQVREIYNLRFNADMVVLSACQTGRGRLESGEGLLGLPRIFFYAGAKSVISTLWPINDKSTSILMRSLYEHLSKGESKSQAIRSAKINMLKSKYAHPFYWAAFVLNGDFGPLAVE